MGRMGRWTADAKRLFFPNLHQTSYTGFIFIYKMKIFLTAFFFLEKNFFFFNGSQDVHGHR